MQLHIYNIYYQTLNSLMYTTCTIHMIRIIYISCSAFVDGLYILLYMRLIAVGLDFALAGEIRRDISVHVDIYEIPLETRGVTERTDRAFGGRQPNEDFSGRFVSFFFILLVPPAFC